MLNIQSLSDASSQADIFDAGTAPPVEQSDPWAAFTKLTRGATTAPQVQTTNDTLAPGAANPPPPPTPFYKKPLFWAAVGGGVAVLGGGIWLLRK